MMFTLQTEGAESLSSKSSEWDFENPPAESKVIESELSRLMFEEGGIGFSANQMGFLYRVFTMNIGEQPVFFYNPVILTSGDEVSVEEEGCLSFPGLKFKVKRPDMILASWQDSEGKSNTQELTGMTSRCFQHELDHLDGVCFVDRVSRLTLDMARKRRAKRERNN